MKLWVIPLLRGWPGWYIFAPYWVRRLRRDVLGSLGLVTWLVKTLWNVPKVCDVPFIFGVAWRYRDQFYARVWRD